MPVTILTFDINKPRETKQRYRYSLNTMSLGHEILWLDQKELSFFRSKPLNQEIWHKFSKTACLTRQILTKTIKKVIIIIDKKCIIFFNSGNKWQCDIKLRPVNQSSKRNLTLQKNPTISCDGKKIHFVFDFPVFAEFRTF